MRKFMVRKYFTFQELLESFDYGEPSYYEEVKAFCGNTSKDLMIYNYASNPFDAKFEVVFNILLNAFFNEYVAFMDYDIREEEPTSLTSEKRAEWVRKFYNIYFTTKDRYLTLISIYETNKENLLEQISEEQKIKFNDTPQNNGNYDDETHISSITTTEHKRDIEPLMERIDKVYRLLHNIYKDWANEFKGLFIYR